MNKIFGIDLGTSNSLIAYKENESVIICANKEGETLIPSVVSFIDEEAYVVGKKAKDLLESNPEYTVFSAKRFIGRTKQDIDLNQSQMPYQFNPNTLSELEIQIYSKNYSIPEISARVLLELKKIASIQASEDVEKVVITVPAFFNDNQRTATQIAAKLAGLQVVKIINEPTAAALAYGLQEKKNARILVYDFGGGTFDVSILKLQNGIFEVLATHGNTMLGGDDIDKRLSDYLLAQSNSDPTNKQLKEHIRFLAEEAKKKLSYESELEIHVNNGQSTKWVKMDRNIFNSLIADLIQQSMKSVKLALRDANLNPNEIDEVILVGGSSRIPLIHEILTEYFGKKPHMELNPDEVVAYGAAIQAAILSGEIQNQVLLDVTPLSIGMETYGGLVEKFIMRNSKIPTRVSQTFTTSKDNQRSVAIHVVQGEREFAKDNISLGKFILDEISIASAGIPRIEVNFNLDTNGILQVSAKDLTNGKAQTIKIQANHHLSDEKVESMLLSAFNSAKSDMEERFLVEQITSAKAIIMASEKAIENYSYLLTAKEKKIIEQSLLELKMCIETSKDRDEIHQKTEALDHKTKRFAETIMNHSIQSVMKNKSLKEFNH